ncbi:hypothetical protein T01_13143, partial [Trichinella spiralis]
LIFVSDRSIKYILIVCCFIVAMPSGKRETERKGNAPVNTGPSPNSDGHADNRVEEADEPARGSGPLHTDKRENSQLEIRKVFKSANAIIILELASTLFLPFDLDFNS